MKLQTVPPNDLLHLTRALDNDGPQNSDMKARSPHVLLPVCIICEKKSDFVCHAGAYEACKSWGGGPGLEGNFSIENGT